MTSARTVLGARQQKVLRQLGPVLTALDFYLVGGTALALQLGHRRSVDFDWFTSGPLADPLQTAERLRERQVAFVTEQVSQGTLHGTVSGVKVSLLEYRYGLLDPLVPSPTYGCRFAGLRDLAAMKLAALAQRGAKKDFVDIYALVQSGLPLSALIDGYRAKFAVQDVAHLLYSLVYFDDADRELMPKMIWKANWRGIKSALRAWAAALSS